MCVSRLRHSKALLGGWLVTELYITSSLHENTSGLAKQSDRNDPIVDEIPVGECYGMMDQD